MTVYDDFRVRESSIWTPFTKSFPFSSDQTLERTIIFGLFSNTYLNNMQYLETIDAFELALIVDDYNQRIAKLNADEANLILEIASKRYLASIDRLILYDKLNTERLKIAADDAEWDAKIAALESDRAALETMQAKLFAKQKDIQARIKQLQAAITIEEINYQFAEAEVEEKEMDVEKASVQLTLKDVQEIRKDAEIITRDADLVKKEAEISAKELDIRETALQVLKVQLEESETELKILETDLDVSRIQLQVVGAGIKSLQYQKEAADIKIRNAGIEADISKTDLIRVDLANAQLEKLSAEISNSEKDLRVAKIKEEIARTDLRTRQVDNDFLEVDRQAANLGIEKARIEENIAETAVLQAKSTAETARYNGEVSSLDLYDSKIRIINAKEILMQTEITNAGTELVNVGKVHTASISLDNAEHQRRIEDAEFSYKEQIARYNEQLRNDEKNYEIVVSSREELELQKDSTLLNIENDEDSKEKRFGVELKYLETMMTAQILTTLEHSIGVA